MPLPELQGKLSLTTITMPKQEI